MLKTPLVITGLVNVLFSKVCVAVVVTIVPLASGKVIVLSAVGSVIAKTVSCASAVAPSNIIPLAPMFIPVAEVPDAKVKAFINGLVKVLFVNVSVPVFVATVESS